MLAVHSTTPKSNKPIQLRDYQDAAVSAVLSAFDRGVRRQLLQMPTGSGKTVVFTEVIRTRPGRSLVIAHRHELLDQARDKIRMVNPSLGIGVVKAGRYEVNAQVVVASVQTLARQNRLDRLTSNFDTVIIDEAHHAVAASYRRLVLKQAFGVCWGRRIRNLGAAGVCVALGTDLLAVFWCRYRWWGVLGPVSGVDGDH